MELSTVLSIVWGCAALLIGVIVVSCVAGSLNEHFDDSTVTVMLLLALSIAALAFSLDHFISSAYSADWWGWFPNAVWRKH